jgi:hypothetical protein
LRRAQLPAAVVAPVRVAEATACEPLGAAAATPSPEGAELAGAQSVQPGVVEQECAHVVPPTVESAIEKTHMPINGVVFDSIQAELLQPCTTDAYAFKHTAVCTEFAVPHDHPFSVDSSPPKSQLCNKTFWIHCPASVRADYIRLYRRYKLKYPSAGACVLLPYKLPAH